MSVAGAEDGVPVSGEFRIPRALRLLMVKTRRLESTHSAQACLIRLRSFLETFSKTGLKLRKFRRISRRILSFVVGHGTSEKVSIKFSFRHPSIAVLTGEYTRQSIRLLATAHGGRPGPRASPPPAAFHNSNE